MIAMMLTKPGTEVEATVLISCEICGETVQYSVAYKAVWIAVGGGPWRYRCGTHQGESLDFVDVNQCDGCRRGLPIRDGVHVGPGYDMIGCTAARYDGSE